MFSASPESVLSSSFCYAGQRGFWKGFLWARMRLFEDRIELVGWGWTGRHHRVLPLSRIKDLRWWTGEGRANFALQLHGEEGDDDSGDDSDERIYVRVEAAGLWKHEVEARASNLEPTEAKLPRGGSRTSPRARAA